MTPTKKPKLSHRPFNQKTVSFEALVRSITSAPEIVLKPADLKSETRALWGVTDDDAEVTAQMPVCVYKVGDDYAVLTNWGRVKEFLAKNQELKAGELPGSLKVRLISKQLMKHIHTVSIPAEKQNAQAEKVEREIEASREGEYEPRRYGDRPQPRLFQSREEPGQRQQQGRPPTQRRFG